MLHGPTEPDFEIRLSFWHTCPSQTVGFTMKVRWKVWVLHLLAHKKWIMKHCSLIYIFILLIQFTKSQFLLLSLSFGLISVQNSAKSCRVSRTPSPLFLWGGWWWGGRIYRHHHYCPLIYSAPGRGTQGTTAQYHHKHIIIMESSLSPEIFCTVLPVFCSDFL